ncbi:MAG TPA: DedA family protein [Chthoniobacterales bacterium]|nr:DedA family protein [Chthoniobacterales bacterium]
MLDHNHYAILIGLFFLAFVQEDSAVVSSALLGYNGVFPYWLTFVACFLGMWVSDFAIYLIMRFGGRPVLESRWAQRLLPLHQTDRASRWFDRYGGFTLIFSRFVLGTRTALLIVSGLLKYPITKFLLVSSTGAIGWLLLVFSLFAFLGQSAMAVFGARWIIALIVLASGSAAILAARSRYNRKLSLTAKDAKDF